MRLMYHEGLMRVLEGTFPKKRRGGPSKEEAYDELKQITGQDFGYDAVAWRRWFKGKSLKEAMPGLDQHAEGFFDTYKHKVRDQTLVDLFKDDLRGGVMSVALHATKEQALEELKHRTGQDFGYDANAWQRWLNENKHEPEDPKDGENEADK